MPPEKQALYNANYKYCPLERWAELNSFGKIITINGHLDNIQGINDVFRLLTTYQELKGYKAEDGRIYSPTLRYLINTGNDPELYTLDFCSILRPSLQHEILVKYPITLSY